MLGDMEGFVGVYNVNNGALLKALSRHKAEIIGLIHSEKFECIVTASADNVIKIHDDKELADSDFLRYLHIKDFNITFGFVEEVGKVIIGGNNGVVSLHEAATGKGNEEFIDKFQQEGEEVSCVVMIDGASCIIYATNHGILKVLAIPNLVVKHMKIAEFQNTDPDVLPEAKPMCISSMSYCKDKRRLFVADEKHYVKCFDISGLVDVCEAKVQNRNDKSRAEPQIPEDWAQEVWCEKVHHDLIKSMEYVHRENLIFTTCVDKTVKILDSETGLQIESLRQRKDIQRIKPIAYKKVESDEIYTPRMEHRIDSKYMRLFRERQRKEQEMRKKQELGYLVDYDPELEFQQKLRENTEKIDAFQEYEAQEFDPYYYQEKIDQTSIKGKRSNDWNLYLDFDHYYGEFESSTEVLCKEIAEVEENLLKGIPFKSKLETEGKNVQFQQPANISLGMKKKLVRYKDKFESKTAIKEKELLRKMEEQKTNNKKKARTKLHQNLYKQGLRNEMIKKMNHEEKKMRLSKPEIEAAEKLAAALANYDPDDPRCLLFTDYQQVKKKRKKKPTGAKRAKRRRGY
jgi:hypothetical protein